tara:strand:+ start:84 stop:653 length:570 start_codon:yes stop_codon:yes gene_type:complete
MRKIYRNFITAEEAEKINSDLNRNAKYFLKRRLDKLEDLGWDYITKILDTIKQDFKFEINDYSYFKLECRELAHQWHKDTGSRNHMLWNQVGISLLIKEPKEGGETYYAKDNELFEKEYGDIFISKPTVDSKGNQRVKRTTNAVKEIGASITNRVKADRKLYDLVVHTCDQWHEVKKSSGGRCVLLMFI